MFITGRLSLKKMMGFKGWPRIGNCGPGGAQGLNVNNWQTSLKKMMGFKGWPRIGKSGPGGAQMLNVNNWPTFS